VPAPTSNVSPTLASLSSVEAQRIVARSRDKWPQYEVGDGSNQIKVFVNGRKTADLLIGAFKFDQARRSASTYVRRAGEDEVYLVEGFLAMQLTQGADSYRDNTILTSTPQNVTRIEYSLGDDLHVLTRDIAGDWYYAGMESIDSMAMDAYLNGLRNVSSRDFVTEEGPDESSEIGGLRISGNNMTPAEITLYQVSSDSTAQFILGSNMNTDTYFASDSSGVFKTLFADLEQILLEL
jgi:hypothetical protein